MDDALEPLHGSVQGPAGTDRAAGPLLDGDRDRLADYIWTLAERMGLRDWTFKLADDPATADPDGDEPEDTVPAAHVEIVYGRRFAVISVEADWPDWSPEQARHYLAHELVHCHVAPMQWAYNNYRHYVPPASQGVMYAAFTDALEPAVDGIAAAWARRLPLPGEDDDA